MEIQDPGIGHPMVFMIATESDGVFSTSQVPWLSECIYRVQFINYLGHAEKGRKERADAEKAAINHYLVTQAAGKCADVS